MAALVDERRGVGLFHQADDRALVRTDPDCAARGLLVFLLGNRLAVAV